MKQNLWIIFLAAIVSVIEAHSTTLAGLEHVVTVLRGMSTLRHGHKCSYKNELKRQEFTQHLLEAWFSDEGKESAEVLVPAISEGYNLTRISTKFCNSRDNLVCSPQGTCDCPRANIYGSPMEAVREKSGCRLRRGSFCLPSVSANPVLHWEGIIHSSLTGFQCESDTTCKLNNNIEICTHARILAEVKESLGQRDQAKFKGFHPILLKRAKEGMCFCSGSETDVPTLLQISSKGSKFNFETFVIMVWAAMTSVNFIP